jgi:hypothetical protein
MNTKINWFGLAGGVTVILVIVVSMFSPWWQLTVGDNLINAQISPLNTNFNFIGTAFTIPLIWVFNIVSLLTLVASGIAMIAYSVVPTKSYSKQLLYFGYRKPLYTVVFFVVVLFALTLLLRNIIGLNVPLSGSASSTAQIPFVSGTTVDVEIAAGFGFSFWLAAVAAGLCLAARLYHKRLVTAAQKPEPVKLVAAATETTVEVPAEQPEAVAT